MAKVPDGATSADKADAEKAASQVTCIPSSNLLALVRRQTCAKACHVIVLLGVCVCAAHRLDVSTQV